MSCENCTNHTEHTPEVDFTKEAAQTGRIVADMVQAYERQNRRLWAAVIALALSVVVMAGCALWTVTNSQHIMNDAMYDALQAVAEFEVVEETTTTTTEVTQDTGEGSGNNVYLDGDSTTYNESGAE